MRTPTETELQLYAYLGNEKKYPIPGLADFRKLLYDLLMKCDLENLMRMKEAFEAETLTVYQYKFDENYWPTVLELIHHHFKPQAHGQIHKPPGK